MSNGVEGVGRSVCMLRSDTHGSAANNQTANNVALWCTCEKHPQMLSGGPQNNSDGSRKCTLHLNRFFRGLFLLHIIVFLFK